MGQIVIAFHAGDAEAEVRRLSEDLASRAHENSPVPLGSTEADALLEVLDDDSLLLQVFTHLEADAAMAEKFAKTYDPCARTKGATLLDSQVARGTELTFILNMPGALVDDPLQTLVWRGPRNRCSSG